MIAIHAHIQTLHTQHNQPFPTLARLTLQLHDEIILEVRHGFEATVATFVRQCMESVFLPPKGEAEARVPFPVTLKVGRTLGTMLPLELSRGGEEEGRVEGVDGVGVGVGVGVGGVLRDEVRELVELACLDEEEWSDYTAATPASQQLRPSLASTITASPSQSFLSPATTPASSTSYTHHHHPYRGS